MNNLLERIMIVIGVIGLTIFTILANIAIPVIIIYLAFVIAGHFGVL